MAMNAAMRMMLAERGRNRTENNMRSEYGGDPERRMIGYDRNYTTENRRRRDSRGRYMEGGGWESNGMRTNYPWSEEPSSGYDAYRGDGRMEPESRRRRDSRGRYMMDDMDDDETEMRGQRWYPPNMHGGSRYGFGDVYAEVYAPNAMNRPMHGGASSGGDMSKPIDEHTARAWVAKMDGGEHYKPEQLEQLKNTLCPDCDMWSFYVAINAMYSDYCETARKMNIDKAEFYGALAKDFLKDKDAKPHKLRRYMEYIAK